MAQIKSKKFVPLFFFGVYSAFLRTWVRDPRSVRLAAMALLIRGRTMFGTLTTGVCRRAMSTSTAIITGGSSGIGREVAALFKGRGWEVHNISRYATHSTFCRWLWIRRNYFTKSSLVNATTLQVPLHCTGRHQPRRRPFENFRCRASWRKVGRYMICISCTGTKQGGS